MKQTPAPEQPAGPDTLALGRFLAYRLSVLAETVSRAFAQHYEQRFDITIAEWRVMAVLGEHAPQATQAVIERTRMDRVKVSRAAIRLVAKGLITRTAQPGDQRAYDLRLSPRGLAMYQEIVPLAHRLQQRLVEDLPGPELQAFHAMLDRLQARADALPPGP